MKLRWDFAAIFAGVALAVTGLAYIVTLQNQVSMLKESKVDDTQFIQLSEKINVFAKDTEVAALDARLNSLEGDKDFASILEKKDGALTEFESVVLARKTELREIEEKIEQLIKEFDISKQNLLPTNMVVAFDSADCPVGWENYTKGAGRTVIASGQGVGLTVRKFNEVGGVETVVLTIDEMPNHSHETPSVGADSRQIIYALQAAGKGEFGGAHARPTQSTGLGHAHENMPPYIALTMCKKK